MQGWFRYQNLEVGVWGSCRGKSKKWNTIAEALAGWVPSLMLMFGNCFIIRARLKVHSGSPEARNWVSRSKAGKANEENGFAGKKNEKRRLGVVLGGSHGISGDAKQPPLALGLLPSIFPVRHFGR
jgi:hypothetical protein